MQPGVLPGLLGLSAREFCDLAVAYQRDELRIAFAGRGTEVLTEAFDDFEDRLEAAGTENRSGDLHDAARESAWASYGT